MKINEIFKSIQGEGQQAGNLTTFIRTSGCNLRCNWCDTTYAYKEGMEMSLTDIYKKVRELDCKNICITGGEPLLQDKINELLLNLHYKGYKIFVETNGTQKIYNFYPANYIVDYKLPSSGMYGKFIKDNFKVPHLYEIKFVIKDEKDYEIAKEVTMEYDGNATILFSPCFNKEWNRKLAEMIIKDNLPVKYSLQIHKVLWGNKRGV